MKKLLFSFLLFLFIQNTIAQIVTINITECHSNTFVPVSEFDFFLCGKEDCSQASDYTIDLRDTRHRTPLLFIKHDSNEYTFTGSRLAPNELNCNTPPPCQTNSSQYYPLLAGNIELQEHRCFLGKTFLCLDDFTITLCVQKTKRFNELVSNQETRGYSSEEARENAKIILNEPEFKFILPHLNNGDLKGILAHINQLNVGQKILNSLSYKEYNTYKNLSLIAARTAKVLKNEKEAVKYYGHVNKMNNRIPQQKVKYSKEYSDYLIDIGKLYQAQRVLEGSLIAMPNDFYQERSLLVENLGNVDRALYKYHVKKGKKWKDISYLNKRANKRFEASKKLLKQAEQFQNIKINPKDLQRLDKKMTK